jgi:hypothetical protein
MLEKFKPTYYLSDLTKFVGAPSDIHNWVRDFWLHEIYKLGMKGIAVVKTKDQYSELSLKNVLTPENLKNLELQNFKTSQEAENWILNKISTEKL